MIENRGTFELKVGIFVLIGLLVLFVIIFSIGDVYLFKKGYHIRVLFNFANGISESAPVRLAGVQIGEIETINVYYDEKEEHTKVELVAWITKSVKIEQDSKAMINTLGLLGEKYLEIFPGVSKTEFVGDNGIMTGHDPIAVELLTEDMNRLVASINDIADKMKRGEGTLGKLIGDAAVYNNLEEFTADIKKNPWKLFHRPKGE